ATQFAAAAINLALNFLLIPRWSWRGAAAASLLTDAALALFSHLVLAPLKRRPVPPSDSYAATARAHPVSPRSPTRLARWSGSASAALPHTSPAPNTSPGYRAAKFSPASPDTSH